MNQHATDTLPASGRDAAGGTGDLRNRIPAAGLREYWYPILAVAKLRRGRPVKRRILGTNVVVFRTPSGVGVLDDACAHRGMPLSTGRCHFAGTLSCAYHGWTYDAAGTCVAVLSEGPGSQVPGKPGYAVRSYPAEVLKGLVFVWMGAGEPAPIRQDVPPEFFAADALIVHSEQEWACNWRPAMENYLDSHTYYLHRNSIRMLTLPPDRLRIALKGAMQQPATFRVNDRALAVDDAKFPSFRGPLVEDQGAPQPARPELKEDDFQFVFPALGGARWPKTTVRLRISKLMRLFYRRTPPVRLERNVEWTMLHLPAMVRTDNSNHIYTRVVVPIDETRSRVFFLHTRYPTGPVTRFLTKARFWLFYQPLYNLNLTGQDRRVVEQQDYNRRERLSQTDAVPLAWRRLVLSCARDLAKPPA